MVKKKKAKRQGGKAFTHENNPKGRPKTRLFREALIRWGMRDIPTDVYGNPQFSRKIKNSKGEEVIINTIFAEIKKRKGRINNIDLAAMQMWRKAGGNGDLEALKMISDILDGTPVSTMHMGAIDGDGNVTDPAESEAYVRAASNLLAAITSVKTSRVSYEGGMASESAGRTADTRGAN